jgi:hypothetical protein
MVTLSPGITISTPSRQVNLTSYVSGTQVELRTIFVVEWRVTTTFFFLRIRKPHLELVMGVIDPGLQLPYLCGYRFFQYHEAADPRYHQLHRVQNLTEHLHTGNCRSQLSRHQNQDINRITGTLITPRSIRPVATVPRPVMVNTSSMGIKKALSTDAWALRSRYQRLPSIP